MLNSDEQNKPQKKKHLLCLQYKRLWGGLAYVEVQAVSVRVEASMQGGQQGSRRGEVKKRLENDTDVHDIGELWVLGKQMQEGRGGQWMTVTENDRNKIPVEEKSQSIIRAFLNSSSLFRPLCMQGDLGSGGGAGWLIIAGLVRSIMSWVNARHHGGLVG